MYMTAKICSHITFWALYICRQNGNVPMRTEVVVDKSFSILNAILIILGTEQMLVLIWAMATLPVSKQEALRYKNGCFCYLYTESYFYIFDFV